MSKRWLDWFGLGKLAPRRESAVSRRLARAGVSQDALDHADLHRHFLGTRLVSALVEQGVIDEPTGLAALAAHAGLPGICLRRSVVDLSLAVPDCLEQPVLPVQRSADGTVVLASADPLEASERRTLEIVLGAPVQPHLALELYLRRAILASIDLRRTCDDAAYLVGDEVVDTSAPLRVHALVPRAELPDFPAALAPPTTVLIASAEDREDLRRALSDGGARVVIAADGAACLRAAAREPWAMLVVDAHLPGRSGVELLRLVGSAPCYRNCAKVLVSPVGLDVCTHALASIPNLACVTAAELDSVTLAGDTGPDRAAGHAARAHFHRGMALGEEGDLDGAGQCFREALELDPLLGEAHQQLARLRVDASDEDGAAVELEWALDLGHVTAGDVAALAQIWQCRGHLDRAAGLWRTVAERSELLETKTLLGEHARRLLSRDAVEMEATD